MVSKEVTVHTDGRTIWVNSGCMCEVRICGLEKLNGTRAVKAILHEEGMLKDITILR